MNLMLCVLFLALFGIESHAQDERLFRELLLHNKHSKLINKVKPNYFLKARSNSHMVDLTDDHRPEKLFTAKRDGEDWLQIYGHDGELVFKKTLDTQGPWSRLYRIQVRKLNEQSKVMVLYFYEGITRYLEFQGTTRIYFVSYDNNDLKTLRMYKGPVIWDEKRGFKEHYHQRIYDVSFYDLDGDKTREVSISYGRMNRVYKYLGNGSWYNFDDQNVFRQF